MIAGSIFIGRILKIKIRLGLPYKNILMGWFYLILIMNIINVLMNASAIIGTAVYLGEEDREMTKILR